MSQCSMSSRTKLYVQVNDALTKHFFRQQNPSCNLYSCVDHNVGNAHGGMFKQPNSITGLYCEHQKVNITSYYC